MPRVAVALLERVEERGQDARAARADRVAERDGAAVDVDLRRIDAELFQHRDRLHRKRFVDLEQIHVRRASQPAFSATRRTASTGVISTNFGGEPAGRLRHDARERRGR